jgi:hypothetical protein
MVATTGAADPNTVTWKVRVKNYWVNDGPKMVFLFIFFAVNFAVFLERFVRMYFITCYICGCKHPMNIARIL